MKNFVVLEHRMMPDKGLRFYTMNSREDRDPERLIDGRLAYKVVEYVDTSEDAQLLIDGQTYPTGYEIDAYYEELYKKYPSGREPSAMENVENGLKTSWAWNQEDRVRILDPDGWDRKNYDYSFHEELVTKEEYQMRLLHSIVLVADIPINAKVK